MLKQFTNRNSVVIKYCSFLKKNGVSINPDILLVNPPLDIYCANQKELYKTLPPFGLGMLATLAKANGIKISILDAEAMRLSPEEIASIINFLKPKIIGFNITSPVVHIVRIILSEIVHIPDLIIAGGVHPTVLQIHVFNQLPKLDAVFVGEAEESWNLFLDIFKSKNKLNATDLMNIKGVQLKGGRKAEIMQTKNIENLPFIDSRFFYNQPFSNKRINEIGILSSRGCTYSCEYCAASAFSNHKIKYRSIENIVNEIDYYYIKGISHFHFGDDNFTISRNRLKDFGRELKHRNLSIKWKSFSRIEAIDEKSIRDLKESGCYQLTFGLESGSERILNMMNKKTDFNQVSNAIDLCRRNSIRTKGFFIIGYPGETIEEINETIKFAKKINLDFAFFYMARAFPGTLLFDRLLSEGYKFEDLLQYQHVYPSLPHFKLNNRQKILMDLLSQKEIFDINKTLKYNISHKVSISRYTIEFLCDQMAKAYIKFYLNNNYYSKINN